MTSTSSLAVLVGNGSAGTYNLSGGTVTSFAATTRGVMLGVNPNSSATFNLSSRAILPWDRQTGRRSR